MDDSNTNASLPNDPYTPANQPIQPPTPGMGVPPANQPQQPSYPPQPAASEGPAVPPQPMPSPAVAQTPPAAPPTAVQQPASQRAPLRIDHNLLAELGLAALPEEEKKALEKHIYETLEMRVGMRLADQMTNEQLDEFETYFNARDDAGAFRWLETNFPNYKDIVAEEFEKLKSEVAGQAPAILAASQQQAVQPSPQANAQSPAQPDQTASQPPASQTPPPQPQQWSTPPTPPQPMPNQYQSPPNNPQP